MDKPPKIFIPTGDRALKDRFGHQTSLWFFHPVGQRWEIDPVPFRFIGNPERERRKVSLLREDCQDLRQVASDPFGFHMLGQPVPRRLPIRL